jgi:hypothetical protein
MITLGHVVSEAQYSTREPLIARPRPICAVTPMFVACSVEARVATTLAKLIVQSDRGWCGAAVLKHVQVLFVL